MAAARPGQVVGIISSAITTIDRCFERIIPDVKMSRSGRRRYCTLDKNLTKDHTIHKRLLKTTQFKRVIMGRQYGAELLQKEIKKKKVV